MFIKTFIITSLFCSYSIRTPVIENCPFDYEIRTGFNLQSITDKYDIKLHARALYEREIGLHGWGHDVEFSYNKYDYLINKIFGKQIIYYRKLTSYERQCKDMNVQTIDTGYSIFKIFRLGYSIISQYFEETDLMYYAEINIKNYLVAEFRINKDKKVNKIKLQVEQPVSKHLYLKPLFQYIQIDNKKDYWGKLEFGYKFKTKEIFKEERQNEITSKTKKENSYPAMVQESNREKNLSR